MRIRHAVITLLGLSAAYPTFTVGAQEPARAIRRTIPMTRTIQRAHALGTRDSSGRPGRRYWQNRVDYDIRARLDVPTNTVAGQATITLHNESDSALSVVHLRLDQNINASHAARLSSRPQHTLTAGMRVTRASFDGRPVAIVPPRAAPGTPAPRLPAAYSLHNTNGFIRLDRAIPAHGSGSFEIEWSFEVPPEGAIRMGRFGDSLYQVAQWYPRIAVYDDLRGWDTDPYLGPAEFYNNFGRFEVRLDVPAGWLVGATGSLANAAEVLTERTRSRLARCTDSDTVLTIVDVSERGAGSATAAGERLVWRFVADSVSDFAWAASRAYIWKATSAAIEGRGRVPVHLLYLPERSAMFEPAAAVSRHAVEFYSALWFPYPFPQLTLADGPELGMEYPMFIMSAVGAADHEVGHQWWPMVVGNNETWYGWMDEGFNQYMNVFSDAARAKRPSSLDLIGRSYGGTSGTEMESPMMWPANLQGAYYGFTTYMKTPAMLAMLGGMVGDSAVQRAIREWAEPWRFRHPSPWDFMFSMNRSLKQDLGWFWYYWLFTTEAVHGSLSSVTRRGGGTTYDIVVRQDGEMPSPVVLQVRLAPGNRAPQLPANARMMDSTTAIVTWPVDVWFDGARTFRATLDFGRVIESVVLDPFGRFPDRDSRDNSWPR